MVKTIISSLVILFFISFSSTLYAQKVLQIEKSGKAKTEKIFIGETLTFQLKEQEEPFWYTAVVEDLFVEDSVVLLGPRYIHIKNIISYSIPMI